MEEYSMSTPSLPADILIEIFSRLTVKTLIRFCCVSKFWKNLIMFDQTFINGHLKQSLERNTRSHSNVFLYSIEPWISIPDELRDDGIQKFVNNGENCLRQAFFLGHGFFLVGCINGVFCFYKYLNSDVYLWNPALHQCRILPRSSNHYSINPFDVIGLVRTNDDYKVVRIFKSVDKLELDIYNLSSNSWKPFICHCRPSSKNVHIKDSVALVHNEALHWLSYRWEDENEVLFLNVFDLSREKFRETLLSDRMPFRPFFTDLGLFKGCLCLSGKSAINKYEVWMMKEYGVENSWTKQFEFPSDIFPQGYLSGTRTSGKFVADWRDYVVLYDPESEGIERVQNEENEEVLFDEHMSYFFADNYVESLVSVIPPNRTTPQEESLVSVLSPNTTIPPEDSLISVMSPNRTTSPEESLVSVIPSDETTPKKACPSCLRFFRRLFGCSIWWKNWKGICLC